MNQKPLKYLERNRAIKDHAVTDHLLYLRRSARSHLGRVTVCLTCQSFPRSMKHDTRTNFVPELSPHRTRIIYILPVFTIPFTCRLYISALPKVTGFPQAGAPISRSDEDRRSPRLTYRSQLPVASERMHQILALAQFRQVLPDPLEYLPLWRSAMTGSLPRSFAVESQG